MFKCMLTNKLTFAVSSLIFFFLQNCLVKANLDFKVGTRITRTLQQKLAILLKTTIQYVNYFMT